MKEKDMEDLIKGNIIIPESENKSTNVMLTAVSGKCVSTKDKVDKNVNALTSNKLELAEAHVSYVKKNQEDANKMKDSMKVEPNILDYRSDMVAHIDELNVTIKSLISKIDSLLTELQNIYNNENN